MGTENKKEFPNQKPDEKIIFIIRKHWVTLAWPFSKTIFALLIALILPGILDIWFYIFNNAFLTFLFLAWVIFWVNYLIYEYLNWYRDKYIATQFRIVNIDQKSLFHRRVSELELDQIKDIVHEVNGILATTFNFGDVIISSLESDNIELHSVPNPAQIQNLINQLTKEVDDKNPLTADKLIDFIQKQHNNE